MKSRAILLLAALLTVTTLSAAMASASASAAPRPAQLTKHSLRPDVDPTTSTFCLNTDGSACLNVQNCNSLGYNVQIYNRSTGGACTDNWIAEADGTVGKSAGNVFTCGHDWNATYYGDQVYLISFLYPTNDDQDYLVGTGNGGQVGMTYQVNAGYFVATGNSSDTKLIDADASCTYSELQWLYASGKTNGSVVRESTDPASLLFWAYASWGN
jgi:hypothetical protein